MYKTDFHTHKRKKMVGTVAGPSHHAFCDMVVGNHGALYFQGSVLISMEILPLEDADAIPAGFGRHAPNLNPVLPKPVGRFKFVRSACGNACACSSPHFVLHQSFNPFYMVEELIGPELCAKFCCFFACLAIVALFIFGAPFISSLQDIYNVCSPSCAAVVFILSYLTLVSCDQLVPAPFGLVILLVLLFVLIVACCLPLVRHFCWCGKKTKAKKKPSNRRPRGDDNV